MRKKSISMILVATMTAIMMVGCGNDATQTTQAPTTQATEATTTEAVTEAGTQAETTATLLEMNNYLEGQAAIDANLLAESENGYTFEEPLVVVNPYGNSPLTAVVIFSIDKEQGGTIIVKGKEAEDNITGSFESASNHIVPIYGLYSGDTTEVELTLEDGTKTTVSITTDAVEMSAKTIKAKMKEESAYNYEQLTFVSGMSEVFALDSKGDVRWYTKSLAMPFKRLENGHLMYASSNLLHPMYYYSGLIEVDLTGKVYNNYVIPGGQHHDFYEMPNGNLLVAGDRSSFETVEDYLVEIDRTTGEVVWELDMADILDTSDGGSINRTEEDWFHNNGVWYDEATDNILLSARHVDAIVAVNKTNKTLSWILGDPEGWTKVDQKYFFTPVGDDFEWQYAQHQVSILPNGDIMMFDNGAGRTKSTKPEAEVVGDNVYSRAVAYKIDTENMTIEQTFEYGKNRGPSWYSEWISGAVCLDNDPNNIWITAGSNLYSEEEDSYDYGPSDMFKGGLKMSTHIDQVKDNKLVYELVLDSLNYRSIRLPMYADSGNLDVTQTGKFLGDLGETKTVTQDINLEEAKELEAEDDTAFTQTPEMLLATGTYTIASKEELKDDFIVLKKEDGTTFVYEITQTQAEVEDGIKVSIRCSISPVGLEGNSYDIYIMKNGQLYSTGNRVEF